MDLSSSNETKASILETIQSLTPTDKLLASAILKFCRCYKFEDIMSRLQTCLRRDTVISLAYISLRMECSERRVSRLFEFSENKSCGNNNNLPEIVEHPDGFEFSLAVKDINSQVGQLNFGIYHHDADHFDPQAIKEKIIGLIQMEMLDFSAESPNNQNDTITKFIHKVRNPLATILVSSSQLSSKDSDTFSEDDRLLTDYISSEVERIDRMLTEFAETTKSQNNHCQMIPRPRGVILRESDKEANRLDFQESAMKKELILKKNKRKKNKTL